MMALHPGCLRRHSLYSARRALSLPAVLSRSLAVVSLLALAGCSSLAALTGAPPPPPCPSVSVLKDAATVTRFVPGGGQDLIDVVNEGEITGYDLTCEYDTDKKTKAGEVAITLGLHILATRGPADRQRQAPFRYFIAITDPDRNVLGKQVFDIAVSFTGNATAIPVRDEPVPMKIPLAVGKTGRDFEIFTGFQLTPDEVNYNRLRPGAPR